MRSRRSDPRECCTLRARREPSATQRSFRCAPMTQPAASLPRIARRCRRVPTHRGRFAGDGRSTMDLLLRTSHSARAVCWMTAVPLPQRCAPSAVRDLLRAAARCAGEEASSVRAMRSSGPRFRPRGDRDLVSSRSPGGPRLVKQRRVGPGSRYSRGGHSSPNLAERMTGPAPGQCRRESGGSPHRARRRSPWHQMPCSCSMPCPPGASEASCSIPRLRTTLGSQYNDCVTQIAKIGPPGGGAHASV